ncbi:hypothetical protein B484DRAFT_250832 [Ochromonadaceae sp. CCMP2298]|nr:hypothetical protein B484DRAFT_250832 [Ochromonadaceae sp. CCMP2298]
MRVGRTQTRRQRQLGEEAPESQDLFPKQIWGTRRCGVDCVWIAQRGVISALSRVSPLFAFRPEAWRILMYQTWRDEPHTCTIFTAVREKTHMSFNSTAFQTSASRPLHHEPALSRDRDFAGDPPDGDCCRPPVQYEADSTEVSYYLPLLGPRFIY